MFKVNQEVYIISSTQIEKVIIVSIRGEFCTVKDLKRDSGYRVRKSRLYGTIEEAVKDPYYRPPVVHTNTIMHPHIYELMQ